METHRNNTVGPVIGLSLIVIGAVFLLVNLFRIGAFWPLFILIPGILLLLLTMSSGRSAAPLAVPAVLISGTGAILLYQSTSGDWGSWAYIWTLYPALLGGGMVLMGRLESSPRTIHSGRRLVALSLAAFAAFWLLFRATIFSGLISTLAIPLILISLGVVWMLRSTRRNGAARY